MKATTCTMSLNFTEVIKGNDIESGDSEAGQHLEY